MINERLMQVLLAPHVSEKSTTIADKHRQIVFEVASFANKIEVKNAVEKLFNVKVKAVRISNVKGKVKRSGKVIGKRNDWKKAYVALEEGFDINFTSAE